MKHTNDKRPSAHRPDSEAPSETRLGEAYYKRYGVYYAAGIIKKLTGQITLSLREMYGAFRGKERNNNR